MKKTLLCAALLAASLAHAAPLEWRGISLSSAEWGEKTFPGVHGKDFVYPSVASTAYYQAQGMNVMRVGFRWERLQPTLMGELDPAELARLREFVDGTTARGLFVMLDPHNYAAYKDVSIGKPEVPVAAFADFWRRQRRLRAGRERCPQASGSQRRRLGRLAVVGRRPAVGRLLPVAGTDRRRQGQAAVALAQALPEMKKAGRGPLFIR
jgi:hypothetical protein